MRAPWSGQLSAAKTGWLVMLLFFGWLGYLLVPAPKPEPQPPPAPVREPPSRLVALGLPDNPDFEHLPDFFAVYANEAEWKDGKTIFAYWNPSSNSYSYFFEATRDNGKQSFRLISKFEAYRTMTHEDEFIIESEDIRPSDADIAAIGSITESQSHPLVLFHSYRIVVSIYEPPSIAGPVIPMKRATVPLEIDMGSKSLPKIETNSSPVPDEAHRK